MRKTRYGEEQIIRVLQEVEAGATVKDVCPEDGIAEGTTTVLTSAAQHPTGAHFAGLAYLRIISRRPV